MKRTRHKLMAALITVALVLTAVPMMAFAADESTDAAPCEHVHSEECYAAPEGHICAEDERCTPIYPLADNGEPDTAADPVGWDCGALELVCGHADCAEGEVCVSETDATTDIVITEFAPLKTTLIEYTQLNAPKTQDALPLPATLAATVEGQDESAPVPVTWAANREYTGAPGKYIFTAVLGEGYVLTADDLAMPTITVGVSRGGPGGVTRATVNGVNYLDASATTQTADGVEELTGGGATTLGSAGTTTWYVVNSDISYTDTVTISGEVNVILANGFHMQVTGGTSKAGINVASGNTLNIYANSTADGTMGQLTATSNSTGAGMGGNNGQSAGVINIYGGKISATSQSTSGYSAGIGGGYHGNGGDITIYGGNIVAISNSSGAGIGGGYEGTANVTIKGGTIKATSYGGAGIGSGSIVVNQIGTVKITGGNITAEGRYGGAGIGGGYRSAAGTISITTTTGATISAKATESEGFQAPNAIGYGEDYPVKNTADDGSITIDSVDKTNEYLSGSQKNVTLPETVAVDGVSLNKDTTSIYVGGTETLTAIVSPAGATNKAVTWASSNTGVATVSGGTVTAVAPGTATITVTSTDGGFTDTCTVTVNAVSVTGITVKNQPSDLDYAHGENLNLAGLVVTLTYSNSTTKDVAFADFGTYSITASPTSGTAMSISTHNGKPVAISCGGFTVNTSNLTVNKAAGPAAPTVTGSYTGNGTTFTYTVTAITDAEYSKDNGVNWQDSNVFAGFTTSSPATTFYARIKGTTTTEAGAIGNTGAVTFNKLTGPAAPSSVTGSYTGNGTTFTYTVTPITNAEYSKDNINWTDDNVFTGFTTASPATTFYARIKTTDTHLAGTAGNTGAVTFNKLAGPAAPSSVTGNYVADGNTFTYTVTTITGAEYQMDSGAWQDTNVFSGITPSTTHTFNARIKTTDTHLEGAIGTTGSVTFSLLPQTAPALNYTVTDTGGSFPKTITITTVTNAEYSFNGGAYSATNTYTSASAEDVVLAIRMPATATHNESAATTKTVNTSNVYTVIQHPGAVTVNADGTATGEIDATFTEFRRLTLNGVTVDPSNYSAKSGSTIITFNADYLKTLSVGTYTFRAEFGRDNPAGGYFLEGYADLTLTVQPAPAAPTPAPETPASTTTGGSPQTGDNTNMGLWVTLLLVSAGGFTGLAVWRIRRKQRKGI